MAPLRLIPPLNEVWQLVERQREMEVQLQLVLRRRWLTGDLHMFSTGGGVYTHRSSLVYQGICVAEEKKVHLK